MNGASDDPKPKSRLPIAALLVFLFVAALSTLFWYRTNVASLLAKFALERSGFSVERIEFTSAGSHDISINELVLRNETLSIKLIAPQLSWSLLDLLMGHFQRFSADRISVSMVGLPSASENKSLFPSVLENQNIYSFLHQLTSAELPLDSIEVKQLELHFGSDIILKGVVSNAGNLHFEGDLLVANSPFQLAIEFTREKGVELSLTDSNGLLADLILRQASTASDKPDILVSSTFHTTAGLSTLPIPLRSAEFSGSVTSSGQFQILKLSGEYALSDELILRGHLLEPVQFQEKDRSLLLQTPLRISMNELTLPTPGWRTSLSNILLSMSAGDLRETPALLTTELIVKSPASKQALEFDLSAKLQLGDENVFFEATNKAYSFKLSAQCFLNPQLRCDLLSLKSELSLLSKLFPDAVEIHSGNLQLTGSGSHGSKGITGALHVSIDNVSGSQDAFAFSGVHAHRLNVVVASTTPLDISATSSGPLRLEELNSGILISDLTGTPSLGLDSETLDLRIRDFSGRLLGGTFRSSVFKMSTTAKECTESLFVVSGVQLSQIAALYGSQSLQAEGELEGHIPVKWCSTGATVSEASFRSTGKGGWIRYQPSASVGSAPPGLELVYSVLRDYRFSSLQAKVTLNPEGSLLAQVSASGMNPAVNKGQQVNVNLEVEENVPSLLKSLRVGQAAVTEVTREIGKGR